MWADLQLVKRMTGKFIQLILFWMKCERSKRERRKEKNDSKTKLWTFPEEKNLVSFIQLLIEVFIEEKYLWDLIVLMVSFLNQIQWDLPLLGAIKAPSFTHTAARRSMGRFRVAIIRKVPSLSVLICHKFLPGVFSNGIFLECQLPQLFCKPV